MQIIERIVAFFYGLFTTKMHIKCHHKSPAFDFFCFTILFFSSNTITVDQKKPTHILLACFDDFWFKVFFLFFFLVFFWLYKKMNQIEKAINFYQIWSKWLETFVSIVWQNEETEGGKRPNLIRWLETSKEMKYTIKRTFDIPIKVKFLTKIYRSHRRIVLGCVFINTKKTIFVLHSKLMQTSQNSNVKQCN